jgi:hypothetical protein
MSTAEKITEIQQCNSNGKATHCVWSSRYLTDCVVGLSLITDITLHHKSFCDHFSSCFDVMRDSETLSWSRSCRFHWPISRKYNDFLFKTSLYVVTYDEIRGKVLRDVIKMFMKMYNYYSQRNNNVNLFIYIALHVSTSNRSCSGAASFLHTVTKLQR